MKPRISGKDLIKMGYPEGPVIGLCINLVPKHFKRATQEEVDTLLRDILDNPSDYFEHPTLSRIAEALIEPIKQASQIIPLREETPDFKSFGLEHIEKGALDQMRVAMRLPISHAGALMPDAHQGYGLPIGGVLATENAVIPYGVGVDIGCRMCLSILPVDPQILDAQRSKFKKILLDNTRFGFSVFEKPMDDEVLERSEFREIPQGQGGFANR
jgi:tRNA-splicing ligase RtcB (3'-phosphate/5'-hydroxy nucleic acid ligase)